MASFQSGEWWEVLLIPNLLPPKFIFCLPQTTLSPSCPPHSLFTDRYDFVVFSHRNYFCRTISAIH